MLALVPVPAPVHAEAETVSIAFVHPHAPESLVDEAAALLAATNAARRERGLAPLRRDPQLDAFAMSYARTMVERRFFGHTSPDGVTFESRIKSARIPFALAEENIALDRDAASAHAAFMNSPGHRANLLSPNVDRMGVAAVAGGQLETIYVEEFVR